MKRNSTVNCIKLLFVSLLCFISCDKDDVDELALLTDAEIIIEQSKSNADEVIIDVQLSNPEVVSNITYYINDQVISNQPAFPFTTIWNTKGLEDGTYNIKATLTTQQGEEKVLSEAYTLSKSLLKLTIEEGYFDDFMVDSWILLSDTNGNLIDYHSASNGMEINFERPVGFTDGQFHVTIIEIEDFEGTPLTAIDTYLYQKKDEWLFDAVSPIQTNARGEAIFKVKNIPNSGRYTIHASNSGAVSSNFGNTTVLNARKSIYKNPASIYLSIIGNDGTGKYTVDDEVYYDENLDLDYLSMKDLTFTTLKLPENDFFLSVLRGIKNANDPPSSYIGIDGSLESGTNQGITLGYPPDLFDSFMNFILIGFDTFNYAENLIGEVPESIQIPEHEYKFDIRNNKDLSYSATGPFDFIEISGNSDGATSFRWAIFGPIGNNYNVKLPEIPREITEKYNYINDPGFTFKNFSLRENFDIEGYDEYVAKVFKLDDGAHYSPREYKNISATIEGPSTPNGRLLNDRFALPLDIQRHLEQYIINFPPYRD